MILLLRILDADETEVQLIARPLYTAGAGMSTGRLVTIWTRDNRRGTIDRRPSSVVYRPSSIVNFSTPAKTAQRDAFDEIALRGKEDHDHGRQHKGAGSED